jgi:hypothetical protein
MTTKTFTVDFAQALRLVDGRADYSSLRLALKRHKTVTLGDVTLTLGDTASHRDYDAAHEALWMPKAGAHAAIRRLILEGGDAISVSRVLVNNVILKGDYNPHNVGLWLIHNEFGAVAMVWASNEGDALDEAVDADLMQGFAVEGEVVFDEAEQDYTVDGTSVTLLGNAGEPFDLTYCGCRRVDMSSLPTEVVQAFRYAEAEGCSFAEALNVVAPNALALAS